MIKPLFKTPPSHFKPLPSEALKAAPHPLWEDPASLRFALLKRAFFKVHRLRFHEQTKTIALNSHTHPLTPIALNILFPGTLKSALLTIHNMPERSLKEKIKKEYAFRNLILTSYALKEVVSDKNNALRAVITLINPGIDSNNQEITAFILRGDLIDYVIRNPRAFSTYFQNSESALNEWRVRIVKSDNPLGKFELSILSDLLETPIHIYSYEALRSKNRGKLVPDKKNQLGTQYANTPLNLYYDPIRKHFHPMQER